MNLTVMPRINVTYFTNRNLNKRSEKGPLKKKERKDPLLVQIKNYQISKPLRLPK